MPSRLEELATEFEGWAEKRDPFNHSNDSIIVPLTYSKCAEIARLLRAMQTLADQATRPFVD